MNNIKKVIITSASGYGPAEDAYQDVLTITNASISYEYFPYDASANKVQKWTYKTCSEEFQKQFDNIVDIIPKYFEATDILHCTDIGPIDLTVIYDDKTRKHEHLFCPSEYFREIFFIIRKLIPPCEYMPEVLIFAEDDEELPFN